MSLLKRQPGESFKLKRWWLLALLVPAGVLCAATPGRLEKYVDTIPNPRVSLNNLMGQVVIKGWDRLQVRAIYTFSSPRIEVDAEPLPGTGRAEKVHFNTHVLDPLVTGKDQTVDYVIDVPVGASVEIRNRQGGVQIDNLQGEASVDAIGGTIFLKDIAGHLSVRSVGSNIEIVRSSGHVEASTITGNLHFISPFGAKLRGNTTSGKITYEGDLVSGGDYELTSYSGDIDLLCPPSASFEVIGKTVRGKLDNEFPIRPKHHSPIHSGISILGTHNSGNATVEISSFSGNIHIRQQQ